MGAPVTGSTDHGSTEFRRRDSQAQVGGAALWQAAGKDHSKNQRVSGGFGLYLARLNN
jgi:hypothetical protein